MKNIKITGFEIIVWNRQDETGALKELGVEYKPIGSVLDSRIIAMEFYVDLDFILRHKLLSREIYENYYKGSPPYMIYYNEGRADFLAGKDELDNPYLNSYNKMLECSYPWFDGYREIHRETQFKKHKIEEFSAKLKSLLDKYKINLEYTDYEGYGFKTADDYEFYPIER